MAICGEVGDTEYFRDMMKMDMELYRMKAFILNIEWFVNVKLPTSADKSLGKIEKK